MTREEAIDYLKWVRPKKPYTLDKKNVQTAIDMAIEALKETERNPTVTSWHDFDRGYNIAKEKFERPHGEWIFVHPLQEDDGGAYICSICKIGDWNIRGDEHFCPNCGVGKIIAWMQLPEPYKGEGDEK